MKLSPIESPLVLVVLLVALLNFSSNSEEKSDQQFTINGYIEGVADGQATLGFLELGTNDSKTLDSAIIENGKFIFQGSVDSPYQYSISINDSLGTIYLFLENSAIDITGSLDDLAKVKITGSREDSLYRSYPIDAVFNREVGLEIMTKYPDYVYASFVAYYQFQKNNFSLSKMDSIMTSFSDDVKKSTYYSHLNDIYRAVKSVRVGEKAPDFNLPNINNELIGLNESLGNYTFIHFIPSHGPYFDNVFSVLNEKFNEDNLAIISISVDESITEFEESIEIKDRPWTSLRTKIPWGPTTDAYGVKYTPQNFLLDKQGFIVRKNMDYRTLVNELEMILAENK